MSVDDWLDDDSTSRISAASKHAAYRERNSAYRSREHSRNTVRDRSRYNTDRINKTLTKPFVMWDTEGTNDDATPFLFGSSDGDRIAHPALGSKEMLDLILAAEFRDPDVIHFGYGFDYDVNMILREMPHKSLFCLKQNGKVKWDGYEIEHVPRKWFTVKRGKIVARIFDVVSFFGVGYAIALEEHGIGTDEERSRIRAGKARRSTFTYHHLGKVEPYWRLELKLGPVLMDKMREAFYDAGMFIHKWHGPGALARYGLTHHGIKETLAKSPEPVHDAARYAFCGGRFEPFQAGLYTGEVFNADINSAYPYAATFLPNLVTGRWTYISGDKIRERVNPTEFAVYHIAYDVPNSARRDFSAGPQPLFRRYNDDRVMWPNSVTGWYWSPEAFNVRDNPHARFVEAYIFNDDGSRPFAFLADYYEKRLLLKRLGDPTQITFKLFINSIYGQLAQRAGWQRGIPPFHQIELAGFITSLCRASIYSAALAAWNRNELISCDTDGIFTTGPIPETDLPTGIGTGLGQWEVASVPGMLFWQSGVYWLPDDDGGWNLSRTVEHPRWRLKKARGAPKGSIPFHAAIDALGQLAPLKYKRSELIGYRWGLRNGMDNWRYFVTNDREIAFGGGPYSKRQHNPRMCRLCRGFIDGSLHDLSPSGNGFTLNNHSKMHVLPWEKNDHERLRDPIDVKSEIIIDHIWTEEP